MIAKSQENLDNARILIGALTGGAAPEASICRALTREQVDKPTIYIGAGTCGLGAGAGETLQAVRSYLDQHELDAEVVEVGCIGLCAAEPLLDIQLPGKARVSFQKITGKKVAGLLDSVIHSKQIPADRVLGQFRQAGQDWSEVPYLDEHPFFAPQTRCVLQNCGLLDPVKIDEYLARDGYKAFAKAVTGMTREELCEEVKNSGLRGRGGGGFPTGVKWTFALKAEGDQKYMVCNADEGDPGAFMDRAVIEGDPYRLLEGLAIAAYAIGATKAYIYIRAEYPLAIERLNQAIAQLKELGLLGKDILGSGFDLEVIIKKGAGAFVCGEETALLHSIEGKRGMPRPRPPFPAVKGLFGKPTVINNVETLANLPDIVRKGADWFAGVGTETSKGTKVFALSGKVARTGLVEVAMGTKVRNIIFDIGGGIPDAKAYKSVQIGGPSGGCITPKFLDIEIDYESLKSVGAMMGSGGLVVMDEDTCMVDVARFFMDFIQRESCGKCTPCREGTKRLLEMLSNICSGTCDCQNDSQKTDRLDVLKDLAESIRDTALCGLGQTAPNPVLSTLKYFRNEYEAHLLDKTCPSGVCVDLLSYHIDPEACKGCGACIKVCPADAINGARRSPHHIDQSKCVKCGSCVTICKFDAVAVA